MLAASCFSLSAEAAFSVSSRQQLSDVEVQSCSSAPPTRRIKHSRLRAHGRALEPTHGERPQVKRPADRFAVFLAAAFCEAIFSV